MTNRNTLYEVGSYLIHLYDKIGGIYYCSQVKLEKLILLAADEYYKRYNENMIYNDDSNSDELLYNLKVYKDKECGLLIDTSNTYFRAPITCSKSTECWPINNSYRKQLEEYKESKIFNFDEKCINDERIKECLIDTFLKFGAYDARTLKNFVKIKIKFTPEKNDGLLIPQNCLFNLIEYLEQEIEKDKPVWYGDGNYHQTSIYDGELKLLDKIKDLQEKAFGMTPDECYESYQKSQENEPKKLVKTKNNNKGNN